MSRKNWCKLLNTFYDHHRTIKVGNTAAGIWARMLACTATHRQDGFVDEAYISLIVPSDERWALQRLIEEKLIEVRPGGYYITKYLDHNLSRAQIEKREERESEGGKKSQEVQAVKAQAISDESNPLAKEHLRLYNLYPVWHSVPQLKQWMAACAQRITTPELVRELEIAINVYTEGEKEKARIKGENWKAHAAFMKAPANFLADQEEGAEYWRFVLLANETPIAEKEKEVAEKAQKPIPRELLPWAGKASDDDDDKRRRASVWTESRIREFIEERLAGKSEKYRQRWLEAHQLTHLFAPAAVAS